MEENIEQSQEEQVQQPIVEEIEKKSFPWMWVVVGVVVLMVVMAGTYAYFAPPNTYKEEIKEEINLSGCTEEAKICPDDSSVGRIPPSCEFEECPTTEKEKDKESAPDPVITDNFEEEESSTAQSHEPSYINTKITTVEPANLLRLNLEFLSEEGGGLVSIYFDGDLVEKIDQRFVPKYLELEIAISGSNGTVQPGTHDLAIRLDGFGDEEAGVEITDVEIGLLVAAPSNNEMDSVTISNIRAIGVIAVQYNEKSEDKTYDGFCEYDLESGEVGLIVNNVDPESYTCIASGDNFVIEAELSDGSYYCMDGTFFYGKVSGSSVNSSLGACLQT